MGFKVLIPLGLKVSSDPELLQFDEMDEEDVLQLDHFTLLGEDSQLGFFLLEPRKDDESGLRKVWDPSGSSVDKDFPQ